jgi:Protein of unknown function (DUF3435)
MPKLFAYTVKKTDWATRVRDYHTEVPRFQREDTVNLIAKYFQMFVSGLSFELRRNALIVARLCLEAQLDSKKELHRFHPQVLGSFMEWLCENANIGAESTLQTYWNALGQVYNREMLKLKIYKKIPYQTKVLVEAARARCVEKYGLRTEPKAKPIMRVEDLFELLKTLYLSDDVFFTHERHRIALTLAMQIAAATANRPSAVLQLRYEDVDAVVVLDDDGPRLSLHFSFKHTKKYKGRHKGTYV